MHVIDVNLFLLLLKLMPSSKSVECVDRLVSLQSVMIELLTITYWCWQELVISEVLGSWGDFLTTWDVFWLLTMKLRKELRPEQTRDPDLTNTPHNAYACADYTATLVLSKQSPGGFICLDRQVWPLVGHPCPRTAWTGQSNNSLELLVWADSLCSEERLCF